MALNLLVIAMIINLIALMPFIVNNGWAYIQEIWRFMIIFSIINSVLEKIIRRGMLLSRFSEHFGNRWAVMITSIGFAFVYPFNNGYIEGVNNTTKVIKRISYGIKSFQRLRKKILFRQAIRSSAIK
jgi:membrane protease YdiL (CAAX protease family)